ncbi:putative methylated-DNA-protein-cysteine methyltransferase [Clavispora lusitaniae]|uniref:Methylated-DNA-protein-cysteine methyltransferase n=1 Tax=Clavispora lusitaniae TaxID=36911 RepID=A0ACD0WJE2_CLALS|nr:putative methylated-DNA-protein-cysteine methyltransferase [Clavispora lusitaniae]QFZ33236.1 putative methylated-DNA-protein-cysteine methyltransferase [Clavispora lusitaniae]QFZ38907.1 putative methylated-DNA-protein-cysteine methyltransferase [Clavispora lusitaniae]QFZ44589.1 putative methylated-DNA-protein-cysteine methyltransferase [Clavispora lusitaniae]QFZ50266.1 putative methylated-DNA-protein-cysteine methyltransferase [Clavispora lusitaniae]
MKDPADYPSSFFITFAMSGRGGKALTLVAVGAIGWYTGVKFWQPIIVEQLKKDGNLRDDVYVKDYSDQPKSWQDVKDKVKETLHPGVDFDKKPEDSPVSEAGK